MKTENEEIVTQEFDHCLCKKPTIKNTIGRQTFHTCAKCGNTFRITTKIPNSTVRAPQNFIAYEKLVMGNLDLKKRVKELEEALGFIKEVSKDCEWRGEKECYETAEQALKT